jgi:gliding motility-associated-like protein
VNVRFFTVVFTTDGPNPLCIGDTTNIFVTSPQENRVVSWMWTPMDRIIGPVVNKSIRVSPPTTTTYTVRITYDDGCVITGDYTLVISDFDTPIECSAERDSVLSGESIELRVSFDPSYTYQWEPADLVEDPTAAVTRTVPLTENVQFCVTVTNRDGCEAVCCLPETFVTDITCEESLYLPNAFSPNGDGINDLLFVRIFNRFEDISFELIIYNRYGQQMFKTTDLSIGWDGTYKNTLQPTGAYGYHLSFICPDGQRVVKKGNVSIIR